MSATNCSNCGAEKVDLKSCVCRTVWYCNITCQKKDWRCHKPSCPPYVIRDVPGKGKGVVATRKLNLGSLIMAEEPLIMLENKSDKTKLNSEFGKLSNQTKKIIMDLFAGTDGEQAKTMMELLPVLKTQALVLAIHS